MLDPHDSLLALHVIAGSLGLILGPLAIWASRHGQLEGGAHSAYHWSVLAVCLTAAGLVALDLSALWWLLVLAGLSYALALLGFLAPRRRWRGWVRAYARGQGGSYIALVTASLVVSVEGPPRLQRGCCRPSSATRWSSGASRRSRAASARSARTRPAIRRRS